MIAQRRSPTKASRPEPIFALGKTHPSPSPYCLMGTRQVPLNQNSISNRTLANFFRPSQLRKLRGREQVAAVCYRLTNRGIEFLLVQTRGSSRWIFPKGGTEPGLTHAQAAALEAFEEAGVHGRIEEIPFARYARQRNKRGQAGVTVHAHLCEVTSLEKPQESGRNPTWFCFEKAKRHLRLNRSEEAGEEFVRVLDRAFSRIQRVQAAAELSPDNLHKVQFEASSEALFDGVQEASFIRYFRGRRAGASQFAAVELAVRAYLGKALRLGVPKELSKTRNSVLEAKRQNPLLTQGELCYQGEPINCNAEKVTAIDRIIGNGRVSLPNKKKS